MTGTALFISFEGGEGGGKTTQIARLADLLRSTGREVVVTREPGGTKLGTQIRQMLLFGDADGIVIDPAAQALLFAADRAQHVAEVIRPALERGAFVLTDRYVDSSLAYQGAGNGHGVEQIAELSRYATGGLMPDITFLLDIDPLEGLKRARVANIADGASVEQALDTIERMALGFHERLRAGFLALAGAESGRFVVLDASAPADDVATTIAQIIRDRISAVAEVPAQP